MSATGSAALSSISTIFNPFIEEGLQIYEHPEATRKKLRTVNPLELVNRELKRRTRVARIFPNMESLLRLVTAVLVEIHEDWLTASKPYL
jgi:transposase-like protein